MKLLIKTIRPHVALYRDTQTGLAWIEDGTAGLGHSCHPNISASGSLAGMVSRGYWSEAEARKAVRSHGFIYNILRTIVTGELDEIARKHCQCGGVH